MYYTIYKVTNQINGKVYIGKHQTENLDDSYLGSGKNLRRAIEKHGRSNFKKEILFTLASEQEMNDKEAELVDEEFVARKDTYNLCVGGQGGFSYINQKGLNTSGRIAAHSSSAKEKRSATMKVIMSENEQRRNHLSNWCFENGNGMQDKTHSEETKKKMSGPRGKYNVQKTGIKRGPYKKKFYFDV